MYPACRTSQSARPETAPSRGRSARRTLLPLLGMVAAVAATCPPLNAQAMRDGMRLAPLYRLERTDRTDTLYTVGRSEVDALAGDRKWAFRGLVGYGPVLSEQDKNLVTLNRYRDKWGFHYFANFLKRPNRRLVVEPLGIKVWKNRAPGTIPVYGSSDVNDRCIHFALSRQALEQYDDDYTRATGRRRKSLGVVFYMYPPNYQRSIAIPPDFAAVDWSLLRGDKYRYGPAALEHDGRRYLFYGGNIDRPDRPRLCDQVLLRVGELADREWRFGEETVVLASGGDWSQGNTPWDWQRAGVPTVVRGEFSWQRPGHDRAEIFPWAMFYSAWDKDGGKQIALALARELKGPWHKVDIIVPIEGGNGTGRAAALSRDGRGGLLLLYLRQGESCMVRELDLTDVNNPVVVSEAPMTSAGLTTSLNIPDSRPGVGSIVLDPASGRVWSIRPQHPLPKTPPRTSTSLQLASIPLDQLTAPNGVWTVHADFNAADYGFLRLFDPGFVRTPEGHVINPQVLDLYVSTGTREGPENDSMMSFRIHALRIDQSKVEAEDAGPGAVAEVPGAGQR